MKFMIVLLALGSLLLVWMVVVMDSGSPISAVVQEPEDPELQALLEARRDTLADIVRLFQAEIDVGTLSPDFLSNAELLALEAEHELAKSQKERIAILQKMMEVTRKREEYARVRWETSTLKESEFLSAKARHQEASINLRWARKGVWSLSGGRGEDDPPITGKPEDEELRKLLVEHRDTLKTIRQLVAVDGLTGTASIGDLINVNDAYLNAERKLAKSPQEQVEILKEGLRLQTEAEQMAKGMSDVGTLKKTEYLSAKAARIKAEIELHTARRRAM